MLSTVVLSNENQTCRDWEAPTSTGGGRMSLTIKKGEKYFVEETRPAVCRNVELINTMALHSDYNILRNDKKAMIVYDDNSWNYQGEKDRIELLKKLSQIKCQVVITVDCWDDLIGKNTRTMDVDDLEAIKKNIENWGWKAIQLK